MQLPGEAYAMWTAGELMCQHLELNGQRWPTNWSELERTYRLLEQSYSGVKAEPNQFGSARIVTLDVFLPASFEQVTNLVLIDWDADVQALRDARVVNDARPFRVFKVHNGRGTSYEGREPNRMLWDYLQPVASSAVAPNPK